jgi:hypothetical protein
MPRESKTAQRSLAKIFKERAFCRVPDMGRRKSDGEEYKKGWEVRLPAYSKPELANIRKLLKASGLNVAKSFEKTSYWIQPIYGKEAYQKLTGWVREFKIKG